MLFSGGIDRIRTQEAFFYKEGMLAELAGAQQHAAFGYFPQLQMFRQLPELLVADMNMLLQIASENI
jgi:hypothetical protein